jgi:DNA-binding NarL/FixJ family response regulator
MDTTGLDPHTEPRIRILLADDHENVRVQMRTRLGRERDLTVVAEAANSPEFVEHAVALRPEIALIDPMMRDGLGLQTLRWVADHVAETTIVVLTAVADTALQMELRQMGVCRILSKGIPSTELVGILRDVGQCFPRSTLLDKY